MESAEEKALIEEKEKFHRKWLAAKRTIRECEKKSEEIRHKLRHGRDDHDLQEAKKLAYSLSFVALGWNSEDVIIQSYDGHKYEVNSYDKSSCIGLQATISDDEFENNFHEHGCRNNLFDRIPGTDTLAMFQIYNNAVYIGFSSVDDAIRYVKGNALKVLPSEALEKTFSLLKTKADLISSLKKMF